MSDVIIPVQPNITVICQKENYYYYEMFYPKKSNNVELIVFAPRGWSRVSCRKEEIIF